jgi:hypothetical protein
MRASGAWRRSLARRYSRFVKICESCVHRRIVQVDEVPMGVNRDNRRVDAQGHYYHLFCSYFYSFPSADLRLNCSHHTVETEPVLPQAPTEPGAASQA